MNFNINDLDDLGVPPFQETYVLVFYQAIEKGSVQSIIAIAINKQNQFATRCLTQVKWIMMTITRRNDNIDSRRPCVFCSFLYILEGVGWGGANSVMCFAFSHTCWPSVRSPAIPQMHHARWAYLHIGWGGVGLITSCALRSHTHAGLVYRLLQFHRCIMPAEHIFTWVGWGGWGGANNVMCCACSHACCPGYVLLQFHRYTPQVDNFSSVCPVRWKNVSNVAGTQMLERTWQNLQGFLPKPMCPKYKDKGQSKMLPSVPEHIMYIYVYIYVYNIYMYV